MIKSFGDKQTKSIFEGIAVKKIPLELQKKALRRLRYLDATKVLEELRRPPSNRLEKLKGDLKEFWSIRVNDQYRIIFKWKDGDSTDVKFTDYH